MRRREGPHRFTQKRRQTAVLVLRSGAAAETKKIDIGEIFGVARFSNFAAVSEGGLNRSMQHFILRRKDGVCRWIRDFVGGLQRPRRRSYGIAGSAASR